MAGKQLFHKFPEQLFIVIQDELYIPQVCQLYNFRKWPRQLEYWDFRDMFWFLYCTCERRTGSMPKAKWLLYEEDITLNVWYIQTEYILIIILLLHR